MSTLVFTIVSAFITVTYADNQGYRYLHPGTVMMGGYYGMPPFKYPNFPLDNNNPQLEAAENEFNYEKESVTEDVITIPEEQEDTRETPTVSHNIDKVSKSKETVSTKKIFTKKTNSKPIPDDETPLGSNFPLSPGGSSFFNTFFPIMVGGNSGVGRKSGDEDGFGGGATAIANSFSTGRGGVASSHATSFGDVYLSSDSLKKKNGRIGKDI